MPPRAFPLLVVHHARSGVSALHVVSAALDAHPRTRDVPVRFAAHREATARAAAQAAAEGYLPVVAWSFYSPDFPAALADHAWVRERLSATTTLHVAGGVHATA